MTTTTTDRQSGPQVTVAIPVYNSAATLERCIRSAMRQTLRDIEILVADDASTDGSGELAERLAAEDPRIKVLRLQANGGKPHAHEPAGRGRTWHLGSRAGCGRCLPRRPAGAVAERRRVGAGRDTGGHGRRQHLVRGRRRRRGGARRISAGRGPEGRHAAGPGRQFGQLCRVRLRHPEAGDAPGVPAGARLGLHRADPAVRRDFYYLMHFFAAGGAGLLVSEALYYWTMPFGTISRQWTQTGAGAWRYDYRQGIAGERALHRGDGRQGAGGHGAYAAGQVAPVSGP